jgi:hypothetical protein
LPADVRRAARAAYARFAADPFHTGLNFKELSGYPGVWSCRINISYRAVGRRTGDVIVWFWIGSQGDFDRQFG